MARAHGSRPALPTKPRPPCHPTVARSRSQSLRSWSTCAWLAQPSPLRWLLRIRFVLAPGELYAHQQADLVESVLWYLTGATKPRLGQASAVLPSLLPSAPASAPPPYHLAPPAILVHRPRHAWERGRASILLRSLSASLVFGTSPPFPSVLAHESHSSPKNTSSTVHAPLGAHRARYVGVLVLLGVSFPLLLSQGSGARGQPARTQCLPPLANPHVVPPVATLLPRSSQHVAPRPGGPSALASRRSEATCWRRHALWARSSASTTHRCPPITLSRVGAAR